MKKRIGNGCILLGALLLLSALGLSVHNYREAKTAEASSVELVTQLVQELETIENPTLPMEYVGVPVEFLDPSAFEMTEVNINGHPYIGYLSIPSQELELPIMSDWDYDKLQIAPCRYYGSVLGRDLVLMAHNYPKHFGPISKLQEGDSVIFTDMDGVVTKYEVVAQDVLDPAAVEEMTAGDFDLTLFTCTYGGASRVTVYCDILEENFGAYSR